MRACYFSGAALHTSLACTLALTSTLLCTLRTGGRAMLAPALPPAQESPAGADRAQDMKAVQTALESKVVRERLKAHGLSDAEVRTRLDALSDAQVHQLAVRAQAVDSGGHSGGDAGGFVLGLLFITLLVVLIVYLVKRV